MTDEPEVPLDLDMLMTLDPLKLSKQDIDTIIQHHRNIRASREAGQGRKAGPAATPPKGVAALLAKPIVKGGGLGRRGF